jgi:hypothetical protein
MAFKPLHDVFDGRLKLPGDDGKIYCIPEPDQELGLWCTALLSAGIAINLGEKPTDDMPALQLDDDDELALYRRILGPVFDELAADGYGFPTQKHFACTAFFWIGLGEEAAQQYWNSGGDPKASAPRAARRHPRPAPTASMSSTGAASTTPSQGSTNGTKRPRQPRRH